MAQNKVYFFRRLIFFTNPLHLLTSSIYFNSSLFCLINQLTSNLYLGSTRIIFLILFQIKMTKTKLLILTLALSAFLSGLFFCTFQSNGIKEENGHSIIQTSGQNIPIHIDWVEEIEFGEEDNFLDLGLPLFANLWLIATHLFKDKLQLVILLSLFALYFQMKGNRPFIYLLDCVFRI